MATWLVTGGAGFIGANFVRHLLSEKAGTPLASRVVVYDALTYAGHLASLEPLLAREDVRFVEGDVCDGRAFGALLDEERPDFVVHMAAESHVDRSIHSPAPFLRTNVEGTFRVLEAVRQHPGARLVVVSTDEVYGSLGPEGSFTEETPLAPSSPYSASKASADLLALAYANTYGLDVLVTRCSNNYGPFQMPEKLIPLMVLSALKGAPLPVYGDGRQVRDWIHVEDHCIGVALAAIKGRSARVYNLGGEAERENLGVVRHILRDLGKPETQIRFVSDRPGHDRRYAMTIERSRTELGFSPRVVFEAGLSETIRWYKDNQRWCRSVESESHRKHLTQNYSGRVAEATSGA
jgi:dTDP-glucose 4,6-dehydratase